jgi:kynurenine formamidase
VLSEAEFRALASSVDRSRSWGDSDQRGALNLLTPAAVLGAIATVTRGELVSCADRAVSADHQAGADVRFQLETSTEAAGSWLAVNESIRFEQHGASSMTHLDALGHFFYDGVGYAGVTPGILTSRGVRSHDVLPGSLGIVGRGLLLDLPRIVDVPFLDRDTDVDRAKVERWLQHTGTEPRPGDVLFVRTGRPVSPQPGPRKYPQVGGLHLDCAAWVHQEQFALIVSDAGLDSPRAAVENVATPWHVLALTKMGISLVDFADLELLSRKCAREGRQTFLAVIAPLPLRGATASPVNPIAVF